MSGITDSRACEQAFLTTGGRRFAAEEARRELGIEIDCSREPFPELGAGELMTVRIRNRGTSAVLLERAGLTVATAGGALPRGGGECWRVFHDAGACGWCGVKRLDALDPDPHLRPVAEGPEGRPLHRSSLQTVVFDATSGWALLVGFLGQRRGPNNVDVLPDPSGAGIERVEAWQEYRAPLDPGATLELDPLVAGRGDPYTLLERYAAAVAVRHGRRFDSPPIVGMMSWYGYRTAVDQEILRGNARIIALLFGGYPQPMRIVMLVDHGWEEDANWGFWEPDRARFGRGIPALARELRTMGVELGLWYTPFCVTDNAPNLAELEPLLALDAAGEPVATSASVWGALPGHRSSAWRVRILDGTREEVQAKWLRELERMRSWGTSYWKLDFFSLRGSDSGGRATATGDLYARTWKTFREAVGPEGHLAPCSCATNLQLGYADSLRIASDIGNAGHWPGAMGQFRFGLSTIIALWYKNRTFWVNDADSIQVAKGCSLNEARVRATLVAMGGGHLMLSEDLRRVDGARIEMIRRLLPPCPHAARPLDLFEHPFPEGYPALWALSVPHESGEPGATRTALAVFNLEPRTRSFAITPAMLGLPQGAEILALEWWNGRWLGRHRGPFELEVPGEDVAVVHAQPVLDLPGLVSVSHHISGGTIVSGVSFDGETGMLGGTLETKAGLPVVLFGTLPAGWKLGRSSSFHATESSCGGWQAEVLTSGQRTPFAIGFQRAP